VQPSDGKKLSSNTSLDYEVIVVVIVDNSFRKLILSGSDAGVFDPDI